MNYRISCLLALVPIFASAQDYALYETQYLTPLPGHADELSLALERHNQQFHSEEPYAAYVHYVVNGPRSGDYFWLMGPSTFSDYDNRPTGIAHDNDWSNAVMSHVSPGEVEYWVQNEELSYMPDGVEDEDWPLMRLRFFEVSNNAMFQELQRQIIAVQAAMGSPRPREMYRKQFLNRDGRDWVTVTSYRSWAELDADAGNAQFQEAFRELYGNNAWDRFTEQVAETFLSREDEWHQAIPELSGPGADD